jgi:hypothetical protein
MIEIIPPLGKYKYDIWRILPVKCYNGNSVHLWSYIQNINKDFWHRWLGGSQYLLSIYILHGIILTSIISLTDLSATLWLFVVVTEKCFVGPKSPIVHHLFLRFTSRYLYVCEAIWRLLEFDIYYRTPSVERLPVHLPGMNYVQYEAGATLTEVLESSTAKHTMLTAWFDANFEHNDGRHLSYCDFPKEWP